LLVLRDLLTPNEVENRERLLRAYVDEVTIWQTLRKGRRARWIERSALDVNNGGEAAD
jgi:hypothetical protein